MAIRKPPLQAIDLPVAADPRRHILVVLNAPLEDGGAIEATVGATRTEGREVFEPDVLLLPPSGSSFLERWTSDLGRERAQPNLVVSVATLADRRRGSL